MKARSGKMDGVNYVAAMREQLRRYIQKEELKEKFKKIGSHVPMLLDLFYEKKAHNLDMAKGSSANELAEKKSVYAEQLDSASFQALYEECWDLLQIIFKRKEDEVKRLAHHKKAAKELVRIQKVYKEQLETGYDEPGEGEEGTDKDYRKIFKTIMYPFAQHNKTGRWPSSNVKASRPIGADSLYAHHLMEL